MSNGFILYIYIYTDRSIIENAEHSAGTDAGDAGMAGGGV